MLILGVDSSSKTASAAVSDDGKFLSEINSGGTVSHSENLLPMIDYALKTAGVCVRDINLFAVANGPGSFTGIRIGVATIKGLAFGGNNNCIGVSSLQALAYNFADLRSPLSLRDIPPRKYAKGALGGAIILPVIDARRRQVYNAIFDDKLEYIEGERIITVDELADELNLKYADKQIVFTGDGANLCYEHIKFPGKLKVPEILSRPSAGALCKAALCEYNKRGAVSAARLAPVLRRRDPPRVYILWMEGVPWRTERNLYRWISVT